MTKKIRAISIIVIAVIILAVGGIWFFIGEDTDENIFGKSLFPDYSGSGSGSSPLGGGENEGGGFKTGTNNSALPILRKISDTPIAGAISIPTISTSTESVRFMERSTGHIYDASIEDMKIHRVSNTTIPKIYEAYFNNDGEYVVARYLDDDNETIKTFLARLYIDEDSDTGTIEGEFLPNNILHMAPSPYGDKIFYLIKVQDGVSGVVLSMATGKGAEVFNFPISEWLPQWATKNDIYLTTKASGGIIGYIYKISAVKDNFIKIIGGIQGMTTLASPDGQSLLFSQSGKKGLQLGIYDIASYSDFYFDISTFPEKCVWGKNGIMVYCGVPTSLPNAQYPDSWYKGIVSFKDTIVSLNTRTGDILQLVDPDDYYATIDVVKPFLGEEGRYLLFTNKRDGMLWALDIMPPQEEPSVSE